MTREEIESGNQALYIFAICLVFVYMLLMAQYESVFLPLPVLLSLPTGIFGSFFFLQLLGLQNNIYAQVALVMLIGLLGKNAILIVEFANQRQKEGLPILRAAMEGCCFPAAPDPDDFIRLYCGADSALYGLGRWCAGQPVHRYGSGWRYVYRYVVRVDNGSRSLRTSLPNSPNGSSPANQPTMTDETSQS